MSQPGHCAHSQPQHQQRSGDDSSPEQSPAMALLRLVWPSVCKVAHLPRHSSGSTAPVRCVPNVAVICPAGKHAFIAGVADDQVRDLIRDAAPSMHCREMPVTTLSERVGVRLGHREEPGRSWSQHLARSLGAPPLPYRAAHLMRPARPAQHNCDDPRIPKLLTMASSLCRSQRSAFLRRTCGAASLTSPGSCPMARSWSSPRSTPWTPSTTLRRTYRRMCALAAWLMLVRRRVHRILGSATAAQGNQDALVCPGLCSPRNSLL